MDTHFFHSPPTLVFCERAYDALDRHNRSELFLGALLATAGFALLPTLFQPTEKLFELAKAFAGPL